MFAEPLLTEQAARRHRFQDAKYALPAAFATCLLIGGSLLLRFDHVPHVEPSMTLKLAPVNYWHGVSLGGWLLMEINPSERNPSSSPDVRPRWMYDQIEADSEIDFVHGLRAVSDEFAIATMRNHWDGYISDESLDNARALGVDSVRIPVGYWITVAYRLPMHHKMHAMIFIQLRCFLPGPCACTGRARGRNLAT